jgi:hypothetical protein
LFDLRILEVKEPILVLTKFLRREGLVSILLRLGIISLAPEKAEGFFWNKSSNCWLMSPIGSIMENEEA